MDDKQMFKTCTRTKCLAIVECDASTYDSKEDKLKEKFCKVALPSITPSQHDKERIKGGNTRGSISATVWITKNGGT